MAALRDGNGDLTLGGIRLATVIAGAGTPTYVYDLDGIAAEARALSAGFGAQPHLVCYAVKANTAGPIVRALAGEGCGADVVSGPELLVARGCGIPASQIVFSGVAKTDRELDLAIAEGVSAIQVESVEEITRVEARASAAGKTARISIRINPGLDEEDLDTHAHIRTGHDEAKFGVSLDAFSTAVEVATRDPHVQLVGLSSHIGSQLTDLGGYVQSAKILFSLAKGIRDRHRLSFLDTGGGFGVDYGNGLTATPADFVRAACVELKEQGLGDLPLKVEPGRCLVAAHGVLLAKVIQRKVSGSRRWVMIDAGMNDLLRPALYQARHRIVPLLLPGGDVNKWRVVGPVCESSDDFGEHELQGDTFDAVAILDAGAYGYTMASRYNGRALPSEAFVRDGRILGVFERREWGWWVADRLREPVP